MKMPKNLQINTKHCTSVPKCRFILKRSDIAGGLFMDSFMKFTYKHVRLKSVEYDKEVRCDRSECTAAYQRPIETNHVITSKKNLFWS